MELIWNDVQKLCIQELVLLVGVHPSLQSTHCSRIASLLLARPCDFRDAANCHLQILQNPVVRAHCRFYSFHLFCPVHPVLFLVLPCSVSSSSSSPPLLLFPCLSQFRPCLLCVTAIVLKRIKVFTQQSASTTGLHCVSLGNFTVFRFYFYLVCCVFFICQLYYVSMSFLCFDACSIVLFQGTCLVDTTSSCTQQRR